MNTSNYFNNSLEEKDIRLSYRGVKYNYEPPTLDMIDGDIGGTYRGQPWTIRQPRHIPPAPNANLKYRGVCYGSGSNGTKEVVKTALPTAPIKMHNVCTEVAKTHRSHLYRLLEKRVIAAKQRGDLELLRLLENESKQLATYC